MMRDFDISVYIGTNGRGIFYGDASGAAPPTTAVPSSTSAPSSSAGSSSSAAQSSTQGSSSTTSAPPPTNTAVQSVWGQCGGTGWTGPTACVCKCPWIHPHDVKVKPDIRSPAGSTCSVLNPCKSRLYFAPMNKHTDSYMSDYSQCIPS